HRQHESIRAFRKALLQSEEFAAIHTANEARPAPFPHWQDLRAPRLVFLHRPKTGGTSFHETLLGLYSAEQVCPERFNGLKNHPAGMLSRYRFFFRPLRSRLLPADSRRKAHRHPAEGTGVATHLAVQLPEGAPPRCGRTQRLGSRPPGLRTRCRGLLPPPAGDEPSLYR